MSAARLLSLRRVGDSLLVALCAPDGVLRLVSADHAATRELPEDARSRIAGAVATLHRERAESANLRNCQFRTSSELL